jgi:DNA polymerase-3 subunit delta'
VFVSSKVAGSTALQGPPGEAAPGETKLLSRLAPGPHAARPWAELHDTLGQRTRHGKAVNLDPAALLLDTLLKIDQTAATLSAG